MDTITKATEVKAIRELNKLRALDQLAQGHSRIQEVFFATTKGNVADFELRTYQDEVFMVARIKTGRTTRDYYQDELVDYIVTSERVVEYGFFPITLDTVLAQELLVAQRDEKGKLNQVTPEVKANLLLTLAEFGIY